MVVLNTVLSAATLPRDNIDQFNSNNYSDFENEICAALHERTNRYENKVTNENSAQRGSRPL
jgi:hypothetical protein